MTVLSLFKTPKPKKSKRGALIKALDDLTSIKVRERDGYRCRRCGRVAINKNDVAHHHIFTKTRLTTRWDERNGVTLDFHCHRWAHAAGEEFRRWVLSWMSQAEYDALYIKSQMRGGFKIVDLEWLCSFMRSRLRGDVDGQT